MNTHDKRRMYELVDDKFAHEPTGPNRNDHSLVTDFIYWCMIRNIVTGTDLLQIIENVAEERGMNAT